VAGFYRDGLGLEPAYLWPDDELGLFLAIGDILIFRLLLNDSGVED